MKLIKNKKKYKLIDQTLSDNYLELHLGKHIIVLNNQSLIDNLYLNKIMLKIKQLASKILLCADDEDSDYEQLVLTYDDLARLRDYILKNYDKYLSKTAKIMYLKNIRFLNLELKKKMRDYSYEAQIRNSRFR